MLPSWEKRPEITAHLNNPAFCSEIFRTCIIAYSKESGRSFPFALLYLILPLILNNRIRERMPTRKSKTIHSWVIENGDLKIGLTNNIKSFTPFTKEAIMFSISYDLLSINEEGDLEVRKRRGKFSSKDSEVTSCLKKAEVLGKILANSGSLLTIYSIFGIKP